MGNKRSISVLLVIYITLAFNFFNYRASNVDFKLLLLALDFLLLLYYLLSSGLNVIRVKTTFKVVLPLLFILPYFSGFVKIGTAGTHFLSMPTILSSFGFLGYYIYAYRNISEKKILNTFMLIGGFLLFIQIYQQFFPQNAVFGIYSEEESMLRNFELTDYRNGLYRYGLAANYVILVCVYYTWTEVLEHFTVKRLLFFIAFFLSLYLTLTRQMIFSTIITLLCSFLMLRYKRSVWIVVVLIAFVAVIGANFQSLFGEMLESTGSDLTVDNIRYASFMYYGGKIFTNPMTFLIGNGHVSIESAKEFNLDPTDIGFVGQAYYYGVLWILLWLYTAYLMVFKYKFQTPLYVKLYVIGTTIHSIGMFPYRTAGECLIWATMLYIVNIHVRRHQLTTMVK